MILCDIGNTSVDWEVNGVYSKQSVRSFNPFSFSDKVFYVCVNEKLLPILTILENWIDVRTYVNWDKYYPTMGIDRVMVCEAIENGVIVDAGSAVTVDKMLNGNHEGGFIALGLQSAKEAYAKLSPALARSFNFEVDLTIMAKNTPDAVTIGYLAPLIEKIKSLGSPIIVTGGDSKVFSSFLDDAIVDNHLIFQGMKKLIEKGQLC
jgi:type III pantothenate kinase